MKAENFKIDDSRLDRLPMFPLPAVHLFPGTLLPLHVFEPRFCDLVETCLARGDRALAVATLQPGYQHNYEGRPAVFPTMGAGVLLAAQKQDDGKWNLIVRGTDRVRLLREHAPTESFREIRAQRLSDIDVEGEHPLYDRLRTLLARLAQRAPQAEKALNLLLSQAQDAAHLTNLVGSHTLNDPQVRQQMLETLDVAERLNLATTHIGRMLLELHTEQDHIAYH